MKNAYEVRRDSTAIFLSTKDGRRAETIIDTADLQSAERMNGTWKLYERERYHTAYVFCDIKVEGRTKKVFLHRWITDAPDGLVTDHINHDGLDNRRVNLRHVSQAANTLNKRGANKQSASGIRGVCWNKKDKRWRVQIYVDKKFIYVGSYKAIEEAEKASIEAMKKHHPYSREALA